MHVFPIIIDSMPPYAQACRASASLLTMPAGGQTLLARLAQQLRRVTFQRPAVFPDFRPDDEYARRINRAHCGCDIPSNARFSDWLAKREPSDLLLFIDPRLYPLGPWTLSGLLTDSDDLRVARFLVAIDDSTSGAEAWAHLDERGNVERIQRYYDNVTRVGTRGVFAAAFSTASYGLLGHRRIAALAQLRSECGAASMPCQDVAVEQPTADLHQPRGLLDLNEHCLAQPHEDSLENYCELRPGLLAASDVQIAPDIRVAGPVVVQPGATIEAKAFLVGPTVIGAGAVIGPDAVVIQSVVSPATTVVRLRSVRHEVAFSSEPEPGGAAITATAPSAFSCHTINEPPEFRPGTPSRHPFYDALKRATDVVAAVAGALPGRIEATGTIEANQYRVAHVSPRISGKAIAVSAALGDAVAEGDVLAVLDSLELGERKAAFLQARANLEVARRDHEREKRLLAQHISSEKEYLAAKGAFERAEAAFRAAREALHLVGLGREEIDSLRWESDAAEPFSHFPLNAPFAGTIIARHITVGELVEPSDTPFTVADLSTVWALLDIYEKDLARIRTGAAATVVPNAFPDERFRGTVTYLSDTVDPSTRTLEARVEVANPDGRLRPGMFVRATIGTPAASAPGAVLVPRDALQRVAGRPVVFVEERPGVYRERPVVLGATGRERAEIRGGLAPGERVVASGSFYLKSERLGEELGGHEH